MKTLVYLLIILVSSSCVVRDNPIIKITNNTNITLDSIEVFAHPSNKTVFRSIKPKDKIEGIISFKGISKQDGGIDLFVYNKSKRHVAGLSYYTNGGSLDYGFKVSIASDTIIVKRMGW